VRLSTPQTPWFLVLFAIGTSASVFLAARTAALLPFAERQYTFAIACAVSYAAVLILLLKNRKTYLSPSFGTLLTRVAVIAFSAIVLPAFVAVFLSAQLRWLNYFGLSSEAQLSGTLESVEQVQAFRQSQLRLTVVSEHGQKYEVVGRAIESPLGSFAKVAPGTKICFKVGSGLAGHLVHSAQLC
jgi:hypothetical protein